ncbi:MAG: hypothetical protein KTR31_11700 [Myxococcales bacterium]|nr:hypothetical protein [Myxococcales bacterium]
MRRELDALRRVFTPPPRTLSPDVIAALELPKTRPEWIYGDRLSAIYDRYREIVQHGELALGVIMMANRTLWEPGDNDAPASIVYTFDPVLQEWPERMEQIRHRLYEFHGSTGTPERDPWRRLLLDRLNSGYERTMHQRIDPEITGGFVAYESAVMLFRRHLRGGVVSDRFLPMLVLRRGGAPHPAVVVPASLWPGGLRA